VTAAEPTGDTGAPGGDELREQVAEAVYNQRNQCHLRHADWTLPFLAPYLTDADAVLALPAVRDALAAQEAVRRVSELHRPISGQADTLTPADYCNEDGFVWPCPTDRALADASIHTRPREAPNALPCTGGPDV
jgi:hypothetical protein